MFIHNFSIDLAYRYLVSMDWLWYWKLSVSEISSTLWCYWKNKNIRSEGLDIH